MKAVPYFSDDEVGWFLSQTIGMLLDEENLGLEVFEDRSGFIAVANRSAKIDRNDSPSRQAAVNLYFAHHG